MIQQSAYQLVHFGFSNKISLFQLNDHPSPKKMFGNKYPFYTGSSNFMKTHFKEYASWLKKNYLKSNSKMIEIGSNDGTFLSNFKNTNLEYLGFEPSKSVALVAKKNNIKTINDFFNTNSITDLNKFKKNTDVICASNVICHIPNLKNLIYLRNINVVTPLNFFYVKILIFLLVCFTNEQQNGS